MSQNPPKSSPEHQNFSCYLLRSLNPKHKRSTYIGFTINPARRIRQHNGELKHGGARKTKIKRPWGVVLVVYGFPNKIAALHFEWAWQNPNKSRLVKQAKISFDKIIGTKNKLQILLKLLSILPWSNFPLKINWLDEEIETETLLKESPLRNITITKKTLEEISPSMKQQIVIEDIDEILTPDDIAKVKVIHNAEMDPPFSFRCELCKNDNGLYSGRTFTYCNNCNSISHIICLAKFLNQNDKDLLTLIPNGGECKNCNSLIKWGEIVSNARKSGKIETFQYKINLRKIVENFHLLLKEEEVVNRSFSLERQISLISEDENVEEIDLCDEGLNLNNSAISFNSENLPDSDFDLMNKPSLRSRLEMN